MCWELPEALGYSTEQGAEAFIFGVSIPVLGVKRKKVEKEGARRVWGCRDFKQSGYNRPWEGRLRVKSWRNERVNLPEHRASPREVRGPRGRRVQEAVWLEQSGGLGQQERKQELQGGCSPVRTLPAMAVCRGGWHLAAGGCWRLPAMQRGQGRTKSGAAVRTPALGAGVLSSWILDLFWGQAYRISDQSDVEMRQRETSRTAPQGVSTEEPCPRGWDRKPMHFGGQWLEFASEFVLSLRCTLEMQCGCQVGTLRVRGWHSGCRRYLELWDRLDSVEFGFAFFWLSVYLYLIFNYLIRIM